MTISTTTSKITYQGNGATTVFTFPFVGDSQDTLEVVYTDATGTSTTLDPSQYTVTINATPSGGLWGIGGSITYPNTGSPPTPIASGTYLTIIRTVPYEQTVTINNQGAFYPQVVEQAIDLLELQIQQVETQADYAIQAPLEDTSPPTVLPIAAERANAYLYFDNSGNPTAVSTAPPTPIPTPTAIPRVVNTTGTATVSVLTSDSGNGISVYQTGPAATTIQLPSGYGPYPIFDGSGNSSTYPMTVLPPAGFTINGSASFLINFNGQSVVFYNDGTTVLRD